MQKIITLLLLFAFVQEPTAWDDARQNFRNSVRESRVEEGLERGVSLDRKIVDRLFEEAFRNVDERKLDRDQVDDATGSGLPIVGSEFGTRLKNELVRRGQAEDLDGFFSLDQALFLVPRVEEFVPEQTRIIKSALSHPSLPAGLEADVGLRVFDLVGRMGHEQVDEIYPELLRATERIPAELTDKSVFKLSAMFFRMSDKLDAQEIREREPLRQRLLAHLVRIQKSIEKDDERLAKRLALYERRLNSRFALGTLIDRPAPELDFLFAHQSGADRALSSLEDLRGKVVVVDFWATWCSPCIASFPHVRDLVSRYEGYDVEVIGVTSLQGKHHPPTGDVIETKGDPDAEFALMREFMVQKNMTWTVAFAKQGVYNADYGISGIPSVALIGADGKVRYRGLHPTIDAERELELIDSLLREAGLPTPEDE